jgi:hypothetical protein
VFALKGAAGVVVAAVVVVVVVGVVVVDVGVVVVVVVVVAAVVELDNQEGMPKNMVKLQWSLMQRILRSYHKTSMKSCQKLR